MNYPPPLSRERGIRGGEANIPGTESLIYINIIKLAREAGNATKAEEWYNKLKSSGIPGLEMYLKNLNSQGIKY